MREMKKKIGLTALSLTLVLSLIGALDAGAAFATGSEDTTPSTVPPTTVAPRTSEVPPTTAAPAPSAAEEVAPQTTVAPTDTSDDTSSSTTREEPRRRWGPDPRWVDYGNCGAGYTACHVAKRHQQQGRFQWRGGHWFRWGTDLVRGHRGETWPAFRQEAARVRSVPVRPRRRPSPPGAGAPLVRRGQLRVGRELVHRHRQRVLRRSPVQPRHLARPTAAPACRTRSRPGTRRPSPTGSAPRARVSAPGPTAAPTTADPPTQLTLSEARPPTMWDGLSPFSTELSRSCRVGLRLPRSAGRPPGSRRWR